MWDFLQVVERNGTWLLRRLGSVHKRADFVCREELDFTYAGERQVLLRIETRQYSHQGLRVLIFTDRPGPRAHLVGVYIELRNLIVFSSAVQLAVNKFGKTTPCLKTPRICSAIKPRPSAVTLQYTLEEEIRRSRRLQHLPPEYGLYDESAKRTKKMPDDT
ncbi:hypothetical protein AVEN_221891-1 [Araneus ventricosus]|uniref:Uncharacterized protein n=1 Tax=Araneus ventricosus TaxID=182803 RepID=A0A4Y2LRY6_ARAVE|nr:hypothetical protein AVEN_221891-1 [Araneus ventricosus]